MEEKLFQEILRQSPFGYACHELVMGSDGQSEDYIFLDLNPAFEKMTGLKSEAILGKKVTEIREGPFDWAAFYGRVAVNGERQEFSQYAEPLKRWYRVTAFSPQKGRFVTLFQEITPEPRQAKTLKAQKEKIEELSEELKMIFSCTQDAMFLVGVKDGEFRYVRNNAAHRKMTGFTLTDLKGKTPVELAGEEIGAAVSANYLRCVEAKKPLTYEETLALPAGKRTWLTTLTPVFRKGKVKYLVGSSKDISRQKKTEEELEKRLKYEKIISGVSQLVLQTKNLEEFLNESLRNMGEGIGVSRAYLFERNRDKGTMNNTFEWTAPGITPQKENLQDIPESEFAWWVNRLKNREVINYRDIEEIPDENTKEILRPQEIKSLLVLPVLVEGEYYGFIGFDDCLDNREWSGDDINCLQLASRIISEFILRKRFEDEILYLSYHDHLTGLYNRRFMEEEIRRLDTPRQVPISVIMGDVNGLKLANDVFGHRAGDLLLKRAAGIIRESCRREDIVARWGGDEFVVLLPRTGVQATEGIVGRIKNKCELEGEGPIQLSIALGYATKTKAKEDLWQVLKEAEEWMYRHKLLQGKSYRNAVTSALKAALFEKSMETEEHAERIKEMSLKIAKAMQITAKQRDELELLAVLHDIGKVAIKESILLKPAPLTEKEWEEIKKHPEIGYRIAQSTPELAPIAEYILYHHERWDGRGYPRGIKGEEIPLLSRILAVVDAYDAMTSDRIYRKALSREKAITEIKRNAGTQFDPDIVTAFIESCCSEKNIDAGQK
ncbi:MAG: diguanylate cyclase [Peptococcaceae bacterium]|jgi:diguanylate cyclase (GGDEF)-like protein/PAS domain S-box-containing protein|nr:diguanylate cyclase [Peptococcaceae bacterium]MDH7526435.1 diguanylate cyclase [Peptococcaceae bacterium]